MKPILGCELYICKKEDHRAAPEGDTYNHLIVLAENDEGYRNLVKIVVRGVAATAFTTSRGSARNFWRNIRRG